VCFLFIVKRSSNNYEAIKDEDILPYLESLPTSPTDDQISNKYYSVQNDD
jgi:hypothetical protein